MELQKNKRAKFSLLQKQSAQDTLKPVSSFLDSPFFSFPLPLTCQLSFLPQFPHASLTYRVRSLMLIDFPFGSQKTDYKSRNVSTAFFLTFVRAKCLRKGKLMLT